MLENLIKTLAEAKARAVTLERSVAKKLHKELKALPRYYGFDGLNSFIDALEISAARAGKVSKPKVSKRRKRTTINAAIRANVKKLIEAGKTGAEVARALKISLPSVQNIKKALGLVEPKKKSSRKAVAPKAPAKAAVKAKAPVKKAKKKVPRKAAPSESVRTAAAPAPEPAIPTEPVPPKA
jgi:hypothetical protein